MGVSTFDGVSSHTREIDTLSPRGRDIIDRVDVGPSTSFSQAWEGGPEGARA